MELSKLVAMADCCARCCPVAFVLTEEMVELEMMAMAGGAAAAGDRGEEEEDDGGGERAR